MLRAGVGRFPAEDSPAVSSDSTGALSDPQRLYLALRQPLEWMAALILLLLSLPLMAMLIVAVTLDSPGGAIFRQERVGRFGRTFTILKLRTMVVDAPAYMAKVSIDDARVTRVGRFLRMSGLDELPQLINVVMGDLNLIGPRPEMKFIVRAYEPWQERRLELRPGITGWWQIHHRSDAPMHLAIEDDLYYIEHVGPAMDLRIVGCTAKVMFKGALRSLREPPVAVPGLEEA
jgi:lipopolysaccharide/colanic/teichoic acid biosynthesis glycosyltransferase